MGRVYGKFTAVRHYFPGKKKPLALLGLILALLAAWLARRDGVNSPPVAADKRDKPAASAPAPNRMAEDFDFYLLVMTLHPAFCADHAREPECRSGVPLPLSIHGLWPERLAHGRYPQECAGAALDLDGGLARELAPLMPGMADGLHEHEWRKHGRCSGLDDDEYFRHTLELARKLDGALRDELTTLADEATSAAALRDYADSYQAGLGATLTFHCRNLRNAPAKYRAQPYLIEIRQCVDNDGANGAPATPLRCASVNRSDQGCGKGFRIARAERR